MFSGNYVSLKQSQVLGCFHKRLNFASFIMHRLSADQLQGQDLIRLQRTSFNSVKSLHIFIHENQGNVDSSEIESLILYGKPLKPSLSVAGYNLFMS